MANENRILNNDYRHFNDYVFKSILQKRANGLLKFVKIPHRIDNVLISEYTNTAKLRTNSCFLCLQS